MRNFYKILILSIMVGLSSSVMGQTPPVQPKVVETPLPAPVELTIPENCILPDVANKPLTADEAASIALRRQPNITVAASGILAAQGRTQQVKAGLLPTLNTGASYTNTAISPSFNGQSSSVSTASTSGYQLTANIRQLLYDFNHTRALVSQAKTQIKSASYNLSKVQSDLVLQVKQAFYNYVQFERLVSVNEANVRNQQSHLASARARLDAGLGLPADVVRAETAVSSAIFNLNLAQTNASIARVSLAQLMGIDPRTPIVASDTGELSAKDESLDLLVNKALKQRPEMHQALANLTASSYGVKAAKTTDSPAIGANVGWLQRGSDFPPDKNSLTYGVSIQWTPFDAGFTKGRIQEAQANHLSSQAELESAQLTVVSDVSQAYLNLKTAEQRIITANSETANAEEALRLVDGRYKAGLGIFLDVLDAQTALLNAKTNQVNAQLAVEQARAAMAHAIGETTTLASSCVK